MMNEVHQLGGIEREGGKMIEKRNSRKNGTKRNRKKKRKKDG